jgi:membrane protease YdiL (CAAX protease family)/CRP-like cAMP-binding protein
VIRSSVARVGRPSSTESRAQRHQIENGLRERLRAATQWDDLSDQEWATFANDAKVERVEQGTFILQEADPSFDLIVLLSGLGEVVKRVNDGYHRISEVPSGSVLGDVAFFDRWPRSASVRALATCEIARIPYASIERHDRIVFKVGESLAARLRREGAGVAEEAKQRAALGELVLKVILLLCLYAVVLRALPSWSSLPSSSSYISLPLILAFGFLSYRFLRKTGYPLADFGIGFRALPMSLVESALLTPIFCGALVFVKWCVLQTNAAWRSLAVMESLDVRGKLQDPQVLKLLGIYLVSCIIQEMIVRSALQASLEKFLLPPKNRSSALLASALMFSINHLHMSFMFASLAFLPGIFWGFLFARRRNLLGPVLSHFVVGAFVFFFLGVHLP